MYLQCLALACVVMSAHSRDREPARVNKMTPAITSSLVNLGKMDISINFNYGKAFEAAQKHPEVFMPQGPSFGGLEPCPCNSIKNYVKNPSSLGGPDDFIDKILSSNDLFGYDKDPISSGLCCEAGSHEHIQEETIFIDVKPKQKQSGQSLSKSLAPQIIPLALDILFGGHPPSPGNGKVEFPKQHAQKNPIEIFFFPNKKVNGNWQKPQRKGQLPKKATGQPLFKSLDIQVVGDKEPRNDFKTMNFAPPLPSSASVKKDLNIQVQKETPAAKEETTQAHTDATTASPVESKDPKDIFIDLKNAPVENKNLPVENKNLSAENKNLPVENKNLPIIPIADNKDMYTNLPFHSLDNTNILKEA